MRLILYCSVELIGAVSSSSSSSESESSTSSPPPERQPSTQQDKSILSASSPEQLNDNDGGAPIFPQKQPQINPEQAFEEFYLRQATKEFANDLDKLRSAPDFNERSLPILIDALKQGTACFSKEERKKVGAAVAGG